MKILLVFAVLTTFACTPQLPIVEYRNVSIPVKCNISIPPLPTYSNNSTVQSIVDNVILLKQDDVIIREILNTCEGVR